MHNQLQQDSLHLTLVNVSHTLILLVQSYHWRRLSADMCARTSLYSSGVRGVPTLAEHAML